MQTHFAPRELKGTQKPDKDVKVFFSTQPDRRAVLFIHGFSGDAIKTWSSFNELLPECPKCIGRDLFFYGYDGLRAELNASASIFRAFLERLFGTTKKILAENMSPSALRADNFEYDELIIVAHSLGAVIARRALLDATKKGSSWVTKTKLILYAPAHKGANVADLAVATASSFPFAKLLTAMARFASPLIDQLKPNSITLNTLLDDMEKARAGGKNPHLVANRIIIAERECIVVNESFGDDPPPDAIPEASHTNVCKPRRDFLLPFSHLEECL